MTPFGAAIGQLFGCRGKRFASDPAFEIAEGEARKLTLLCGGLLRTAQAFAVRAAGWNTGQRREQSEIDVHRLERARTGIDGLDMIAEMAAGDVSEQRAMCGGGRRWNERLAALLGCGETSGQQADGRRLDVAL